MTTYYVSKKDGVWKDRPPFYEGSEKVADSFEEFLEKNAEENRTIKLQRGMKI